MTIQPEIEEPPSRSNGQNPDVAVAGSEIAVLARDTQTTARPRQSSDYRLRGLDLDAHALAEAPARPARKRHPSIRRRRRRLLIQWALVLAVTALAAVVLRATVIQPYSVNTTSMVPTLQPGTDILVVKWYLLTGSTKRGDIIVFRQPDGSNCSAGGDGLVTRVIGLPGETIWSAGEDIYIDGQRLEEPTWHNPPFGELGTSEIVRTTIPARSYFVMGDNRTDTCDSRSFGPISDALVVGQVVGTTTRNGHPFVHFI
jgi:signal peptidase I